MDNSAKLRPSPDGYGYVRALRERIYVAGQRAADQHDDPVAKAVARAHAAADEALLAVIDRALMDGIEFYPALCRTREELVGSHGNQLLSDSERVGTERSAKENLNSSPSSDVDQAKERIDVERGEKKDHGAGLIGQTIPTGVETLPRPNTTEAATVFSDYWQCSGCGVVLYSPTTGLAILNCWNCHKQQWRPIAKPSTTAYQVWCEERKALVGQWSDRELAAADIAIARVTARLATANARLAIETGSGTQPSMEPADSTRRSAAPK